MRLIITRPREDAGPLADALRAKGHETVLEPLLDIVPRNGVEPDLSGAQAIVVTSANGVRALEAAERRTPELLRLPVYAVGQASAEAATSVGFGQVASADGDLAALADLIRTRVDPRQGRLVYVTGATVSGDLAALLAQDGFAVDRTVLYDAVEARELSAETCNAIRLGGGVLLFSPRTAQIWCRLVQEAGLAREAKSLIHYCLSANVARAVEAGLAPGPDQLKIAARPELSSLLERLPGAS